MRTWHLLCIQRGMTRKDCRVERRLSFHARKMESYVAANAVDEFVQQHSSVKGDRHNHNGSHGVKRAGRALA